ncbi:Myosin-2 essential light chain family protein [Ostertagia ostertagi]
MVSAMDDQLADCREVFCYFDSRGDEKISVQQVGDVLRALGQNPTEAEIGRCCAAYEKEARLSFEDFVPIFQSISKNRPFHICAQPNGGRGNGLINVAELRHLLTTLGERLTDEEVDQLLAGHNDSHGNVNIADFVRNVMNS